MTKTMIATAVAVLALAPAAASEPTLDRAGAPLEGTEEIRCVFQQGKTNCVVRKFEFRDTRCSEGVRHGPPMAGDPLFLIDYYNVTETHVTYQGNRTAGKLISDRSGPPAFDNYKRSGGRALSSHVNDAGPGSWYREVVGERCGEL